MTWIKWQKVLINLDKVSMISGPHATRTDKLGSAMEWSIRIHAGARIMQHETFKTKAEANEKLAELENKIIKHKYDNGS
jgi:hypothetical protein